MSTPQPATPNPSAAISVQAAPFRLDWSARLMLFAVLSAIFLAAMDQTVVSTALPTIARDLHGLAHLPWIITAYLLTSTVCLPVYGKLGDLFGRKRLLQIAILIFLAGSALSGLAQSLDALVAFRALQGLGGGGLLVSAIAAISDFIPITQRGRYQGLVGAAFGLATLIGPFLGGFIVETLSWRWIFYINVPFGALSLGIIGLAFPARKKTPTPPLDLIGGLLLITGLSALVIFASVAGSTHALSGSGPWFLLAFGIGALIAFALVENFHPEPLLPLAFFRYRTFTLSVIISFFVGLAMLGSLSFLPLYLQDVRGFTPTDSGLEMLFLLFGMLGTSIFSGRWISRTQRYRAFPVFGTLLISVALGLLSTIGLTTTLWHIDGMLAVLGVGLGMTMQVLVLSAQLSVEQKHLGVATATASLFRSMGGTLGVAGFGAVFAHFIGGMSLSDTTAGLAYQSRIVQALHVDFRVAAAVSLGAFGCAWFLEEMHHLLARRSTISDDDSAG